MEKREIMYLGALLHDIGKFMYRAQPTTAGEGHEPLGEMFIREYLTRKFECFNGCENEIISAANRGLPIIKYADGLAAEERQKQDSKQTRRPLYSIFKYIDIELDKNYSENDYVYYLEPSPLSKSATRPIKVEKRSEEWHPDQSEMIAKHKQSLDEFQRELSMIYHNGATVHAQSMLKTLYSLLWKYTSTISSASFQSEPDISLFDHSRAVAAIANCIKEAEDILTPIMVVKGDISGIQKFIYSEIKDTDKAAKKLRGRSFFIKLLTDTICNYIIRQFDLYDANIIYNSGGTFEILLPANQQNHEAIAVIENHINISLFNMFGAELQIILAWEQYPTEKFFKSYNFIQNEITQILAQKKRQKSLAILDKIFPQRTDNRSRNNDKSRIDFVAIGTKIPHSDYLIEVVSNTMPKLDDKGNYPDKVIALPQFNTYWYLVDSNEYLEAALSKIKETNPKEVVIYNISGTEISKNAKITKLFIDLPIALSFKFIANNAPFKNNDKYNLMEFSEIAKIEADNYPLLGVLRMDVDNLGYIFKKGMKGQSYSIMRMASLSRQLDMFFTRDVDIIAKKHNIYITYSGGDDLFAVGSWVKIIDFAQEVREEFRKYTANNGNITLSGGIAITKDSYPIAKSAQISGDAESKAKNTIIGNEKDGQKDKLSIFDIALRWNDFSEKIALAKKISDITKQIESNSKGLSTGLIYRLLSYVKQTFKRDGSLDMDKMHRLSAKLAYLFARRDITDQKIESNQEDEEIKQLKKQLLNYFLWKPEHDKKRWYSTFPVIGNYVVLKNRKLKKDNN